MDNLLYQHTSKMKEHYEGREFYHWGHEVIAQDLSSLEKYLLKKYVPDQSAAILDVGCGGGRVCLALARAGYQNIHGIDFSDKMIATAQQHQQEQKLGQPLSFQVANATELPFPDNLLDAIVLFANVLCFILSREERLRALREGFRVLKPRGLALLSALDYSARPYNPILFSAMRTIRAFSNPLRYQGRMLPWLKIGHRLNWKFFLPSQPQSYWYLPQELVQDCRVSGLTVLEFIPPLPGGKTEAPPSIPERNEIYLAAQKTLPAIKPDFR